MGGSRLIPAQIPVKPSADVSTLPAAQPTASTPPATGQSNSASAAPAVHHLEVSFSEGMLSVEATNASLNEILREVSKKTGMKVIGGVLDDRVFGHYGPSAPSVVLDALLDGTGTNILIVNNAAAGSELILTPRRGGPSPPSPNAMQRSEADDNAGSGQYVPPVRPYQPPFATGRRPTFGANPDGSPITAPPSADPADPNAAKTPQQIYDQLQRAMQQQKQTPNPPQ